MKINEKIISIPPYLSTTWESVSSLHLKNNFLVFTLLDGEPISIPDLSKEMIDHIFSIHANYMESEAMAEKVTENFAEGNSFLHFPTGSTSGFGIEMPFKLGMSNLDGFGMAMQHNPEQKNGPDLPSEMIQKIASIAKLVLPEGAELPEAEPHCNCTFCQIARAIHQTSSQASIEALTETTEEEVSEADLQFCQWDIEKTGDQLYNVTNRLDTDEKYSVYLGHPVGCTCGKEGCEHILAVLKS